MAYNLYSKYGTPTPVREASLSPPLLTPAQEKPNPPKRSSSVTRSKQVLELQTPNRPPFPVNFLTPISDNPSPQPPHSVASCNSDPPSLHTLPNHPDSGNPDPSPLHPLPTHPLPAPGNPHPSSLHPMPTHTHPDSGNPDPSPLHPLPTHPLPAPGNPHPSSLHPMPTHTHPATGNPDPSSIHPSPTYPHPTPAYHDPSSLHPSPTYTHPTPVNPFPSYLHPSPTYPHLISGNPDLSSTHPSPSLCCPYPIPSYPSCNPYPTTSYTSDSAVDTSCSRPSALYNQIPTSVQQVPQRPSSHQDYLSHNSPHYEKFAARLGHPPYETDRHVQWSDGFNQQLSFGHPTKQPLKTYTNPSFISSQRVPKLPFFSGEDRKEDVDFNVWKYEVNCLWKAGIYSDQIILESIRSSLRGKARSVLLFLGEYASITDIMKEMVATYGNVASVEKLKEQFYSAHQLKGESIVDYSQRLEHLLCSHQVVLSTDVRNDMLCNKLWSGLHDRDLKNATRYKFDTVKDYSSLRRELRQVEMEMMSWRSESQSSTSRPNHVLQYSANTDLQVLQKLEQLSDMMKAFDSRIGKVEKGLEELKRPKSNWNRGWKGQNTSENQGQNTSENQRQNTSENQRQNTSENQRQNAPKTDASPLNSKAPSTQDR